MCVFNSRSICNKTSAVFEYLKDFDVDVACFSETWLRKGDTSKIAEINEYGYLVRHVSRPGRGGGVAVIFKKCISVTKKNCKSFK